MKKYYYKDIFRYYGTYKEPIKSIVFRNKELNYIKCLRKAQKSKIVILKLYYRFLLKMKTNDTHIQIPYCTTIGEGLYIGHIGRIIINPNVVIGKNCNIATGVTIGQENRGEKKRNSNYR